MNIYYVVFGEKCSMVLVYNDANRKVIAGGVSSHALVQLENGVLLEPQVVGEINQAASVAYRYFFALFFT